MRTGITTSGPIELLVHTEARWQTVQVTIKDERGEIMLGIEKCPANDQLIDSLKALASEQAGEVFVDG